MDRWERQVGGNNRDYAYDRDGIARSLQYVAMPTSAATLIQALYAAINDRDLATEIAYIDEDCSYQDLNFPQPFQGKDTVLRFLEESCRGIPDDLLFVIDDITQGHALAVGVLPNAGSDSFPSGAWQLG